MKVTKFGYLNIRGPGVEGEGRRVTSSGFEIDGQYVYPGDFTEEHRSLVFRHIARVLEQMADVGPEEAARRYREEGFDLFLTGENPHSKSDAA